MKDVNFKYYVLNYDINGRKVEMFNVFQNSAVNKYANKEVRKFIRNQKAYYHKEYITRYPEPMEEKRTYGFEGFVKGLRSIIRWQEWSRREYEISVGDAFETDCTKLEKWDCADQCEPNMEMIAREIIYQYKQAMKDEKRNKDN